SHQVEGLTVAEPQSVYEYRLVDFRKRLPASLNRGFQILRLHISQDRRLDSAVRKIEVWSVLFRQNLLMIALLAIAPIAMLNLRSLKLDRLRIAVRRQPVDDGSSGIADPQQLRDFIERLSGGIVASVADVPVGPKIFPHLGKIKMRVAARDHQRE